METATESVIEVPEKDRESFVGAGQAGDAVEEEGMDDLFGDDDDNNNDNDNDIDVDDEKEDGEEVEQEDDDDEAQEEEELKQADLTLERHPRSHQPKDNHAYNFPLPRFLFVDPKPFTPNLFEEQLKEFISGMSTDDTSSLKSSIQFKKLQLMNTIRWRYAKTNSNELFKQSNANIIEWEDGSMSLKLGNEYFDIKTKANDDNLLAVQTVENNTLMSLVNMDHSIQILPPSMKSRAHQILASTLTKNMKMKKSKRINTIVTSEDPELKAREVEKAQREIEKARRRQIQKLQLQEEQSQRSNSRSMSNSNNVESIGGGYGDYDDDIDIGDDYEDDDDDAVGRSGGGDGFVVDDDDEGSELDDDELDKAAERLKKVKRDGAARYREGDGDDDDDEEDTVVRKKRRVVVDEDDE